VVIHHKIRSRIVGKKSPVILASVFLLGAGGLIATAENANRIVRRFRYSRTRTELLPL